MVRIPENFYEKCIKGDEKLSVTKIPDTYSGSYVDQQINSFLNNARTYQAAGFTEAEAASALERTQSVKVTFLKDGKTQKMLRMYIIFGICRICFWHYLDL